MARDKGILVIGAGIAGIQASLDLADMGAEVHLLEETPSIGGRMPQLDKTFPTNDCSICILSPKMSECARHPNIRLHTYSELLEVNESDGRFEATILKRPTYVDPKRCIACGLCQEKCPTKVRDEFDMGLRERKAIYRYFLQSIPGCYTIDERHCRFLTKGKCRVCEKTCQRSAINFDDKPQVFRLEVGSIIVSVGIDPFNPRGLAQYGYGRYKDVITSLELERLLAASGPTQGHIACPSNHKTPKRVAFIQCIGSRDVKQKNDYCSSVCCMYAIKEAVIAREHEKGIEPSIFFMDMRCFGKDFDKYYERAKTQYGVNFVRSRVSMVRRDNNELLVHYVEDGLPRQAPFDLVVLSIGLEPREKIKDLSDRLKIELNNFGFIKTHPFRPVETSRRGIYVGGAASSPKDIPESVMEASSAAARASEDLKFPRQTELTGKEYPAELSVVGERPRIGAFICHCGINIAGVVDVEAVTEYSRSLPYVAWAEKGLFTCSQDFLGVIKQRIKEENLNRVVVASCSPRTHEPLFRDTIREAGLNEYLFEMVNIRDQCSWVHMEEKEQATEKAKDLVRMAISKAVNLTPLKRLPISINPRALVIGGGLSGMVASLSLAEQGYKVSLVEREGQLGGNLKRIHFTIEGEDPQGLLSQTIKEIEGHPNIEVYKPANIKDVSGYVGNFKTTIQLPAPSSQLPTPNSELRTIEIEHGAIIVATGAQVHKVTEYLYGQAPRVITQLELEEHLATHHSPPTTHQTIVMIQCVSSRIDERPYCSRVCCQQAIANAIEIKRQQPHSDIYILYRDIRTYGFKERYYQEARDKGIIFLRYELENKPEVRVTDGGLRIKTTDPILGRELEIDADLLVLSVPITAYPENKDLAKMLKVPVNQDGFFLEAHMKLRPVDFATDGVFMAGLCHNPKTISESIGQARAAAGRAATILSKGFIQSEGQISKIDEKRCVGCGSCIEVCAYKAISLNEKMVAEINEALCKGCGACAATCRCDAIDLGGFTAEGIYSSITAFR